MVVRRGLWDKIHRELLTLWIKFPRLLVGLAIVGIGLAIAGAVLIFVFGLWAFVRPASPTEKKDFLQAVGVLLAGLVGLGGLFFTWRNLNQTRQTAQRTLELTERGQITERFTRAIDQLGATDDKGEKKLEIRLGGIYALEQIASDSPERDYSRDYGTVMEVLTAYVRENAPWPPRLSEGPLERRRRQTNQQPKRMKGRSIQLYRTPVVLALTFKRSWMCSDDALEISVFAIKITAGT